VAKEAPGPKEDQALARERLFLVGLFFGFALGFPIFISDCGLGGIMNAARSAAAARSSVS
jgi:hypothetical protein